MKRNTEPASYANAETNIPGVKGLLGLLWKFG